MFTLVMALRETSMFQHKIQESVEYKAFFFIVRHILCVKSTYLICIDLLLACAEVIKIFSLKSGVDESCQYLPNCSNCSCRNKDNTVTKRCRTTRAGISAVSCASRRAIKVVTLSPATKLLVWNAFML